MNEDIGFINQDDVIELLSHDNNLEFRKLIVAMMEKLKSRKFLNYKKTMEELESYGDINISINEEEAKELDVVLYYKLINLIDSVRSRISSLMTDAYIDYFVLENKHKTLREIWAANYSTKSSDIKRQGEAEMVLYFMNDELLKRKELYKILSDKFNVLNFKMESLSRKITIFTSSLKGFPGMNNEYNLSYNDVKVAREAREEREEGEGWDAIK